MFKKENINAKVITFREWDDLHSEGKCECYEVSKDMLLKDVQKKIIDIAHYVYFADFTESISKFGYDKLTETINNLKEFEELSFSKEGIVVLLNEYFDTEFEDVTINSFITMQDIDTKSNTGIILYDRVCKMKELISKLEDFCVFV